MRFVEVFGGMKCAHAVLLLGGWLLLLPPLDPDGEFDTGAPFKNWDQLQAYDTATECEHGKAEWFGIVSRNKKAPKEKHENQLVEARCVPAEHIYPPAASPK